MRIIRYRLTDHARLEMQRRQIPESQIASVLAEPEQIQIVRAERVVYQSRVKVQNSEQTYLLRVFVDLDREPPDVVTVYRTSKIDKYWRIET